MAGAGAPAAEGHRDSSQGYRRLLGPNNLAPALRLAPALAALAADDHRALLPGSQTEQRERRLDAVRAQRVGRPAAHERRREPYALRGGDDVRIRHLAQTVKVVDGTFHGGGRGR